jgi:hypothetical protein
MHDLLALAANQLEVERNEPQVNTISTGRSTRGRGRPMGLTYCAAGADPVSSQGEVRDGAMNQEFDPHQRLPSLPAGLCNQLAWVTVPALESTSFSFQKAANQHILKDCSLNTLLTTSITNAVTNCTCIPWSPMK